MAIYTAGRRRTMVILLLTSVLLITLDLRGNAVFNAARSGFDYALRPFEIAGEVVAQPIARAWTGITSVDELEAEVERLLALRETDGDDGFGQPITVQIAHWPQLTRRIAGRSRIIALAPLCPAQCETGRAKGGHLLFFRKGFSRGRNLCRRRHRHQCHAKSCYHSLHELLLPKLIW